MFFQIINLKFVRNPKKLKIGNIIMMNNQILLLY